LEPEARHEAFLIEEDRISPLLEGRGGEGAGGAFVEDGEAGSTAQFPSTTLVQALHGFVVHEEEGVAVFLKTGLETVGGGDASVVTSGLAALVEGSVTSGGADDEASFDDVGKDEDPLRIFGELEGFGIGAVEPVEGGAGLGLDLARIGRGGEAFVASRSARAGYGEKSQGGEDQRAGNLFHNAEVFGESIGHVEEIMFIDGASLGDCLGCNNFLRLSRRLPDQRASISGSARRFRPSPPSAELRHSLAPACRG
jgi:hypothetical protein